MTNRLFLPRPRHEHLDACHGRLLFRCWHRGTQENDLILGAFAETYLARFDSAQIARLEALVDCPDTDLFDWMLGGVAAPPEHEHDVMQLLRGFCAGSHHRVRQSEPHYG
jgi:antitoxin CptB